MREVLLGHYFSKKTAAESHRLLVETYGEHALFKTQCFEWFNLFKNDYYDIKDKERTGQPKRFEDELEKELEALLDQDSSQMQEKLTELLEVDCSTVDKRLSALGMIQKQSNWMPYKLKPNDVERRLCTCEQLLQRHKQKGFLHRIVTGDEKWIHYNNPRWKR